MSMLRRKRAKPQPAAGDEFGFDARADAILGEVRAEADRILEDARRRAAAAGSGAGEGLDQRLADRRVRLLELSDELIARGEHVLAKLDDAEQARQSLDRTVRALSAAADEIAFEVSATSLGPRAAPQEPEEPEGGAEDDREAAIQMAAAGATRAQVDSHLREFSERGDPTELLDEVFGRASGADSRVPWAVPRDDER